MRTTAKHFEEFKKEFICWQEYFGRMDWEVIFEWKTLDNADAEITWNIEAKLATAGLNKIVEREDIKALAFYEAAELWTVPLRYMCKARFIDFDTMNQEFHGVVRFLENRLYPLIKGGGK